MACPIIIHTADGLQDMKNGLEKHYVLGQDIDMGDLSGLWESVGSWGSPFSGSLDGRGYTISHLEIDTTAGYVGLFGVVKEATIRNVGLLDVDVKSRGATSNTGSLAGWVAEGTQIQSVYATGSIEWDGPQTGTIVTAVGGGLVGYAMGSSSKPSGLYNSYAAVKIINFTKSSDLIGDYQGSVSTANNYYNSDLNASGLLSNVGTPLTTQQMKAAASFATNWFDTGTWVILEGRSYPMHRTTLEQAVLGDMTINDGAIAYEPDFDFDTLDYTVSLPATTDSVTVSVYAPTPHAKVYIEGTEGATQNITLTPGLNTVQIRNASGVRIPSETYTLYSADYTLRIMVENGTAAYPYRIYTAAQLASIGTAPYQLDGHYELMNDLDLSPLNWEPIGTEAQPFSGTFEGNRHVIRHLTVDGDDNAGLFGKVSGNIRNLGLEQVQVSGANNVGGLVGHLSGNVNKVYVTGSVSGDTAVGGLIGLLETGNVQESYAGAVVTGTSDAGGLIGGINGGSVQAAYWDAEHSGIAQSVGGIGLDGAGMRIAANYFGWNFTNTWRMMAEVTYPLFHEQYEAMKLQSLQATITDGTLTWAPASFTSEQGAYHLIADRYTEEIQVSAVPGMAGTRVVIAGQPMATANVALHAGLNVIELATGPSGQEQAAYRLHVEVPAPMLNGLTIPAPRYYKAGDVLSFTVSYEGDVTANGNPQLPLTLAAGVTVMADYAGQPAGEANKLIFNYTVEPDLAHVADLQVGPDLLLGNADTLRASGSEVDLALQLPQVPTSGVIIDSTPPDLVLTQQPTDTTLTREAVTVQVQASDSGSGLAVLKWLAGTHVASAFATGGNAVSNQAFSAEASGIYTVYAEDRAGNARLATIAINNLITEQPLLELSYSPSASKETAEIAVRAQAYGAANGLTHLKWLPGSQAAAAFEGGEKGADIHSERTFTVQDNGVYTVYVRDAAGYEVVAEIAVTSIQPPVVEPEEPEEPEEPVKPEEPEEPLEPEEPGGQSPGYPYIPWPVESDQEVLPELKVTAEGIQVTIPSQMLIQEALEGEGEIAHVYLSEAIMQQVLDLLVAEEKSHVTVMIPDENQAIEIHLPTSSLLDVQQLHKDVSFAFHTHATSYEWPIEALAFDLTARQVSLRMTILAGEAQKELELAAAKQGLRLIGPAVDYEIFVYDGQSYQPTGYFSKHRYVARSIVLDEPLGSDWIAVYNDPQTGAFHFVPATDTTLADGRTVVNIMSPHNSVYAVMGVQRRSFPDVAGHWAQDQIEQLATKRIVSGLDADTFQPDRAISRAEFVTLLVRSLGLKPVDSGQVGRFTDVSPTAWHASAIETAVGAGLVHGMSDTSFAPDADVTREQMAVLIARAIRFLGADAISVIRIPDVLAAYEDRAALSPWAEESVANLLERGILAGMNERGELAPHHTATRAQAVAMLHRAMVEMKLIK